VKRDAQKSRNSRIARIHYTSTPLTGIRMYNDGDLKFRCLMRKAVTIRICCARISLYAANHLPLKRIHSSKSTMPNYYNNAKLQNTNRKVWYCKIPVISSELSTVQYTTHRYKHICIGCYRSAGNTTEHCLM
jgi:hypothetical protein